MGEDHAPGLCAALVYGDGVNANAILECFARSHRPVQVVAADDGER